MVTDQSSTPSAPCNPVEWRSIVGYEGLYEVSSDGQVVSLWFRNGVARFRRRLAMAPKEDKYGYYRVHLSKDRQSRCYCIHKLVARAFLGPCPPGKRLVAHWDGNPKNNRVENLRWATYQENSDDMRRHGSVLSDERHPFTALSNETVAEIRRRHSDGEKLVKLRVEFGLTPSIISRIATGRTFPNAGGPVRAKKSKRGEESGKAKLDEVSVREIRRLRSDGMAVRAIASRFGIHVNNVYSILNRDTWSHVSD